MCGEPPKWKSSVIVIFLIFVAPCFSGYHYWATSLNEPELRFYEGSNPACSIPDFCNGENLWQWYLCIYFMTEHFNPALKQALPEIMHIFSAFHID